MLTFQDFVEIHKKAIEYIALIPDKELLTESEINTKNLKTIIGLDISRSGTLENTILSNCPITEYVLRLLR
jgi:hypothetical protein